MTGTILQDVVASPGASDEADEPKPIIVIGAGPAGLTAAYLLAKSGRKVVVLESDDVVGGISRTARYKEFRFDIGGHRFFTKIKRVEELWHEILRDEFLEVPRLSRILYSGKFFNYPLKASNALSGLGVVETMRIIASYAKARLRPHPVEENFEQWVSNRFGRRLYEIFFKTYTEKVWGIPCTEIRAEWAAQRVQGLSLGRAILSATSLQKRSVTIKSLIERFHYPRLGPGQMWERCADRIIEMGGSVLLSHRVTSLEVRDGKAISVAIDTPRGEKTLEGSHFLTTMPLRSLVRSIDPPVPEAVRDSAEGLGYRDFILVALVLDKENLFPDNWIYVHTPGVLVGRVQNFGNWSEDMVRAPGKTCLGMEYFCFSGDELWNKKDSELIALATEELKRIGLAADANVVDGTVVRMPKAYPIYDSSYAEHVATIRGHLATIGNLATLGRNGMHKYNNQDHSMYTAMLAIENLDGARHDIWSVNTDYEYHEEQKVDRTPSGENWAALK